MEFKKGQTIRFAINHKEGVVKGKGTIKALVPKGAEKGAARLTVADKDGRVWRPFPSQCRAA